MREEELIEEGFERIDVFVRESGNKNDFYYYVYKFPDGLTFSSSASDESPKNKWRVDMDDYGFAIIDIEDFQIILSLVKKWKKEGTCFKL